MLKRKWGLTAGNDEFATTGRLRQPVCRSSGLFNWKQIVFQAFVKSNTICFNWVFFLIVGAWWTVVVFIFSSSFKADFVYKYELKGEQCLGHPELFNWCRSWEILVEFFAGKLLLLSVLSSYVCFLLITNPIPFPRWDPQGSTSQLLHYIELFTWKDPFPKFTSLFGN